MSDTPRTDRVLAWAHPDGRVIPASTMNTARVDGGAILSGLRDYTIPLCDWRELAEARAECDAHIAVTERLKVALRIRGTGSYVEWAEYCRESVERAERAEAECERLREDAERYRWLKKQRPQPMWASIPLRHQHMVRDDESAIDAAIDAARRK